MSLAVCWWQPLLTAHQAHTLKALVRVTGAEVVVVSDRREDALRGAQGWIMKEERDLNTEILPTRNWVRRIREILLQQADSIHVFGSPFERSKQNIALILALAYRRRVYLVSEPYLTARVGYLSDRQPVRDYIKRHLRPLIYRLYGFLLKDRLSGVFAISSASVEQFARMGIPRSQIFPFGYFVPEDPAAAGAVPEPSRGLRVAYLGSFIERKGVQTLVEAFEADVVREVGATLDLYGPDGPRPVHCANETIRYRGPLPFGDVQTVLAGYDLIVVPSHHDGWAVVVNEAILARVPVLAATAVGAAGMIERWGCGETFTAGDSQALARSIAALSQDRERLSGYRQATLALAPLIQPEVAASYLADCITADLNGTAPPAAPWF